MKYFVDVRLPDGTWIERSLALPMEDASAQAGMIRAAHPEWRVRFTPEVQS